MVLVSGFAVHLVLAPRPPLWFACFAALPARSARPPPPERAPSVPREDTPPYGGGLLVSFLSLFLVAIKLSIL